MGKHQLVGALLLGALFLAACSTPNFLQSSPPATATSAPESGGTGLVTYDDPNGLFSILMPPGWQVSQKETSPLVKVSTLIGGPQGHIAVIQMDTSQLPAEGMEQLLAAVENLIGTASQPNYQEISRTNPGENWVQVESTFTRGENRASHSLMSVRVENESLTSLWMVVLDEAVWEQSVPAVQAIMNSFKSGEADESG